ncbi:T-cell surface glycoprotein CD1a-like isoform X4 [Pteropus vampyrus]|uniref:T-cell surface glycoprotein CD1a-like isoform X4 n=1 Tax=Pteropus vampyrus TaxID=132908 RepID=A0A6P6BZ58_PTEVA|nr:T-cell surface glycoprotein CD1a-like isoform X4 [Pteropus vampyrus]
MPRTNAVRSCFFQEQIFQIIHTSSFYNRSWTQSWSSGWLGDLQTHGWESNSGRIIFLRPWSKGNLSKKEMTEMDGLFRRLYIELYHIFHNYAGQWKFEYPFVVQMATGCELHSGEAKEGFKRYAYQGSELLSFQNDSWLPSPKGGTRAQQVCRLFNQYKGVKKIIHEYLSDTCPRFLLGLLDAGKADLQRQVRPEAWLSIGPNPGSDHRMLICHVSGFYPKPIWAMWMRGEQVQQGTQQSDVLPNADGTWYLRIYLKVETIDTSGLSCRVRHSSLGGQDIILYLVFQEQIFQIIHTSSFYNRSWTQSWSSGWLGDLQTHGWESNSGRIIFLRPWSKGNFSKKEMTEMEGFFRRLFIELYHIFHNYASQWKFEYPFVVQMAAGCELHSGKAKEGFVWFAYQGSDLLNFQNYSWLPSPKGGTGAQQVCGLFNQDPVVKEITHRHISDTCPRFLLGLLDAGKADLQRQVRPEAWLSIGPNPGSDHRMLICHVSGFYPKPIWAMWMRGEQVQQGTQQSDVLPNADGTWYLRIYLNVETIERSGLSCRVRHSSLGGKDIILYLEHQNSVGLIILAVMVPLVLLIGLAFWFRKRWTHCE